MNGSNYFDTLQRKIKKLSRSIAQENEKLVRFNDYSTVAKSIVLGSRMIDSTHSKPKKLSIFDNSKLSKHFDTYQFMVEKLEELDNIIYVLKNSFTGMGINFDKAVKEAEKLRESVLLAVDKSKEVLNDLADKVSPDDFKAMIEDLAKKINSKVTSKSYTTTFSVGPTQSSTKNQSVVGYIKFKNLVGEDKFVYNEFYVIVSYELGTDKYSVVCSKTHLLPGAIKGDTVEGKGSKLTTLIYNKAIEQMDIENSIDALEPRRPPLDTESFKNVTAPYIKKVDIKDNKIIFTCSKMDENKLVGELMLLIMKMVKKVHPRAKNTLKYKVSSKGANMVVEFIFTIHDKPIGKLSSVDLNLLASKYGLNQKQLVTIQKVIEND